MNKQTNKERMKQMISKNLLGDIKAISKIYVRTIKLMYMNIHTVTTGNKGGSLKEFSRELFRHTKHFFRSFVMLFVAVCATLLTLFFGPIVCIVLSINAFLKENNNEEH
jgi:hypothetical protein